MWMLFSSTIQKTNYDMIKQNETLINDAIPSSTILIVDDDEHIRKVVSVHLKEAGYDVETARDGEKALHILEKEPIDMAIVDIMMPIVDGYELTEDIRDFYDIPVILLTAKDQIEDKEKGFISGTDDYLVKPFESKELLFLIKVLFRRF